MKSLERVLTTLQHKEPDQVPLFLLLTMHGAKELGITIKEYFSKAEYVVEGQLKMREKYSNDCIYSFFYAPIEIEAWGGDVIYQLDGPANSGRPFISNPSAIEDLKAPEVEKTSCLDKVLKATNMLKEKVGDDAPIIGVVMSPFSIPVMQMGFDKYIELLYDAPQLFENLMKVNEKFCIDWANAQLAAGATAICYFDPLASPLMIPREIYVETGFKVAKRVIASINGPVATHLASGTALPIIDDIAETGTAVLGVSVREDLSELKAACKGKMTVLGNLNGVEMRRWTVRDTENIVKDAISKAGPGGGFILSDNHGEIPYQVSDEVLLAISSAVKKWGRYPLEWI